MSRRLPAVLAALAAIGLSLWLVHDHTREDSLSADEPIHILSGYFEIFSRTAIINIEHPPLMKMLAGAALGVLPLPPPPPRVPMGEGLTGYGRAFFFENRVSADAIAAAARAPFLLVLAALLLVVFFSARARYGGPAALFALGLLAFDPNLLAHAGVVHTDLGAALMFPATVLAWDWARRQPTLGRLALAALVFGLALATKFSAAYLFPILLLQGLLGARRARAPGWEVTRMLARFVAVSAGALLVVVGVYAVVSSRMDRADQRQVIHEMVAGRGAPKLSRRLEEIARFSAPLGHYLGGLASVARQNAQGGGVNFLRGQVSVKGFPFYFFYAFAAKSTLAFLILTALLVVGTVRIPALAEQAALLLLPAGVLFLGSMGTSYNIGIRHLLPVYPFLALAGAGLFAHLRKTTRAQAAALLLSLPILSAVEVWRIHPHELSYFNPLVGGPEAGRQILSDSNVDWGLDLKRLAAELRRRGIADPTVVYFGGDDVLYRIGVPDFAAQPIVRGRTVAISAFQLAVGPEFYAYHGVSTVAGALEKLRRELLTQGRPVGRIGYSIDFFDLPPKGTTGR